MTTQVILYILTAIAVSGYFTSRRKATKYKRALANSNQTLHSLPKYYGYYTAMWSGIPALLILAAWIALESTVIDSSLVQQIPQSMKGGDMSLILNDIKLAGSSGTNSGEMLKLTDYYQAAQEQSAKLKTSLVIFLALIGVFIGFSKIAPDFRSRVRVEVNVRRILMACSFIAIITTVGIVISVLFESLVFFKSVSPLEFIFGTHWSPTAVDATFGAVPLFVGTLLISIIALMISVPIGLMAAIYLSEYANHRVRTIAKPILELLAGIPTVVYGFFAVLTIAPFIRDTFSSMDLPASSESALAAGFVMGIMIIPFVSSLSDDAISAVPQYLRDGSLGLGATKSETIKQVVLPAALPGVVGGVLLAASRAIGETMIVVMAAGMSANLTANPLEAVTTVTVQIVTLLTGDQEFDSPKTLAAFALALLLFVVTLALNLFALRIVKKYREQYE
ncbi:MAG: phosphate ABC transporter permease subunit PstC [Gammaproteobacteria bacterium]|nr:phosphate ABC transporter permease subunit PstC [Gammaproteobacteria bacterium]